MPKVKTISQLKKKAWEVFSRYIRTLEMDWREYAKCVTCQELKPWKQQQAGHFIPGRHNSILFDERNVHVQCYRCNVLLKGNPRKYDKFMRETYGPEVIEELERLDIQTKQFTREDLENIINKYKV